MRSLHILAAMPEAGAEGGPAACEPPFVDALRAMQVAVEEEIYTYAFRDAGLAARAARVVAASRRFRRRMHSACFDLVYVNTSFDRRALLRDAWVFTGPAMGRGRLFLKFHGSDQTLLETANPAWSLVRRRLFARAAGFGVLSSEERRNFLRAGAPDNKIFQVSNVIAPRTPESREEFLCRWKLPSNTPLLLFIGRFIPAKGLDDTIRACALLQSAGVDFRLLCVGDGPARKQAENVARSSGLADRTHFFGYLAEEQAAGFYAHSTALVFPTHHFEGFPMSVFNAAAAGLPILTTRIRAAADHLREPENCLWIPAKEPGQIASRLAELLRNAGLREVMSANNRRLAARFSAAAVAREYARIFEQIVSWPA